MKLRNILGKAAIALFCSFHMISIGVFALSPTASDPITNWLNANIRNDAKPYVLLTSQWQRWNLFSPDPLRRVTYYLIEVAEGAEWKRVGIIAPASYGWWRRASELKVARRLEDSETMLPLRERFLHRECRNVRLPPGTNIRLHRSYYVIPNTPELTSISFWRNFRPEWYDVIDATTSCPLSTA